MKHIDQLKEELAAEREKVDRLAASADAANVLINNLFIERDALKEKLSETVDALDKAHIDIDVLILEKDAVAGRLQKALEQGANLRKDRDELKSHINRLEEMFQKVCRENEERRQRILKELD